MIPHRSQILPIAGAVLASVVATLLCFAVKNFLIGNHLELLVLSGVVVASALWGRGPGVVAAVTSAASYAHFFLPSRFSFQMDSPYFFSCALMLLLALVIGQMAAQLKVAAASAKRGQRSAQATSQLARDLSTAVTSPQVERIASERIREVFGVTPEVVLQEKGEIPSKPGKLSVVMRVPSHMTGYMRVDEVPTVQENIGLLEAFASFTALAFERIHLVEVTRDALLRMEGEKLRSHILSALSHDLRTPLTGIVAQSERLSEELEMRHSPLFQEADLLNAEARRMTDLVENLLELARLQSGGVNLRSDWNSMEELFASALRQRQIYLGARHVDICLPDDFPLVWCDGVLTERVIVNFLDNTVRHTPDGTSLRLWAEKSPRAVRFGLDDSGPGFPPEAIDHDSGRGGIGLSLCQAIAQAHGGQLRIATRPEGGGARVFVEYPQNEPSPEIPEEDEDPEADA